MSLPTRRSRYHPSAPRSLVLQARDIAVLVDLFHLRFAKAQALYLSAYASGELGMVNWIKRLTALFNARWLSRFDPKFGRYLPGSRHFYYTLETGRAQEVARLRMHYLALPDEQAEAVAKTAAPLRKRLLEMLTEQGLPADRVDAMLQYNTDLALKFISDEPSDVRHRILASTVLSILWFGARQMGAAVENILGDGAVNLSFEHDGKRQTIEPDGFFTIGEFGFALEAETGTSARHKIIEKVDRYLLLNREKGVESVAAMTGAHGMTSFRVLFHCQTDAHARMIEDVISEKLPKKGTGLFLMTRSADLHLGDEPTGEKWSRDHFLKDLPVADGTPIFAHLASRITAPVFSQVTGRKDDRPMTLRLPLFVA